MIEKDGGVVMALPKMGGRRPTLTPEQAAKVLELYAESRRALSVNQICERFGISRSLLHRLVHDQIKTYRLKET